MNEQKIQDLKDALREVMELVIARGEPLSDELKLKLAQVMEYVANRIQELRREEQAPVSLPPQLDLEPGPFPSSNINAFKYDYDDGTLLVKFHGKDNVNNGPVYAYKDVPKFIFDTFRRGAVGPKTTGKNKWHRWMKGVTPSLGAAMYHLIRTNYPYQRVA